MKGIFNLTIIVMITLGLTACSDFRSAFNIQTEKVSFNSLEIEIVKDTTSLPSHLREVLEQAKTQKGYLILKDSDLLNSDTVLVFISSGQKITGGYDIRIEDLQAEKENGQLNIIVRETAPGSENIVSEVITYPFILFSIKGDYNNYRITDVDGNPFKPINLQNLQLTFSTNDKEKANALVEKFINALNNEDSRGILECLNPEMVGYYTTETVETAISDYKAYFKNSPIVKYKWVSSDPNTPNSFIYQLISKAGDTLEINVVFGEDATWIRCEIVDYSYQSKHLLERFIYALEKENKILLAQVLTVSDLDYPLSSAYAIIEKYKEHFDMESLEYEFIKIDSKNQAFIYNIIGQKNDKEVKHLVRIIYKDGLIKLDDPWVPYN